MMYINIIAEGKTEESFVKEVLTPHFARLDKFVSVRLIQTGWDKFKNKPAKGGLLKYHWLKNDIEDWIKSDKSKENTWYTTFVDLYAFPKDDLSPYSKTIQKINNIYTKIDTLEKAIDDDINHPRFLSYVQLHEFETFLMIEPEYLLIMYPDARSAIKSLKKEISGREPEEINESPHTAPSKRIIKHIPEYEDQKATIGPLVTNDIGLIRLREKCPHFDEWITKLENL